MKRIDTFWTKFGANAGILVRGNVLGLEIRMGGSDSNFRVKVHATNLLDDFAHIDLRVSTSHTTSGTPASKYHRQNQTLAAPSLCPSQ
jgi:hypothetical protein